jgi:hypothetical protein
MTFPLTRASVRAQAIVLRFVIDADLFRGPNVRNPVRSGFLGKQARGRTTLHGGRSGKTGNSEYRRLSEFCSRPSREQRRRPVLPIRGQFPARSTPLPSRDGCNGHPLSGVRTFLPTTLADLLLDNPPGLVILKASALGESKPTARRAGWCVRPGRTVRPRVERARAIVVGSRRSGSCISICPAQQRRQHR